MSASAACLAIIHGCTRALLEQDVLWGREVSFSGRGPLDVTYTEDISLLRLLLLHWLRPEDSKGARVKEHPPLGSVLRLMGNLSPLLQRSFWVYFIVQLFFPTVGVERGSS